SLKTAVLATLLSPSFLFIAKHDVFDDFDFATRLSLALWRTSPDDHLLDLAENHTLRSHDVLDQTVDAMLADPRADHRFDGFIQQWLAIDQLPAVTFEPDVFPGMSPADQTAVVGDLEEESRLLFTDVVATGVPVDTLVNAEYSFLNKRLAGVYGVTPPA